MVRAAGAHPKNKEKMKNGARRKIANVLRTVDPQVSQTEPGERLGAQKMYPLNLDKMEFV